MGEIESALGGDSGISRHQSEVEKVNHSLGRGTPYESSLSDRVVEALSK